AGRGPRRAVRARRRRGAARAHRRGRARPRARAPLDPGRRARVGAGDRRRHPERRGRRVAMRPVVSVVVATYNFERFLPRALDSVLAQGWPAEALDVVVVDDGSTDGTPELVRSYTERHPN